MSPANFPDGFQIERGVDPKGRLVVEQLLREHTCNAVDYRQSTESTNTLALQDLACRDSSYPPTPKLFLADQQTAGRGRHGRRWVSSDATLTFSLIEQRSAEQRSTEQRSAPLTPLAVGLGIARFVEFAFAPVQVRLKWPNDVHVGGGKVAGILMETSSTRPDRLVIGVGINVGRAPRLDSSSETDAARGLAQVLGRSLERYDLLYGLVTHVLQSIRDTGIDAEQTLDEFRKRCLLSGQQVSFHSGGRPCEGRCHGISNQGALIVETEHGVQHLHSGEANLIRARV